MIGNILIKLKRIMYSLIYLLISVFIKRKENYVVIGSWCGEYFNDNSRYLAEFICRNNPKIKLFWVGLNKIKKEVINGIPGVVFISKDNFWDSMKLLKCKYMFFSQMHNADICSYNVFRKAQLCYLHHGFCVKKWGQDGLNQSIEIPSGIKKFVLGLCGIDLEYDYFVTSSELQDITHCTALAYLGCSMDRIIRSGTPRNDIYFNIDTNYITLLKEKYSKKLKFDVSKKVIAYLPTYRRTDTDIFSFTTLSDKQRSQVDRILSFYNCVLIEKSHFAEKTKCETTRNSDTIIGCKGDTNVQELMMFSDVLLTDYSGAYLDYLFLDRPIIHYAYDYEYYKEVDSGLYYDIEDFCAGIVSYDFEGLLVGLESVLQGKDTYANKRNYVKKKYMSYECGHASEFIVNTIIEKKAMEEKR